MIRYNTTADSTTVTVDSTDWTADEDIYALAPPILKTTDWYTDKITPWQAKPVKARFLATVTAGVQPYVDDQAFAASLPVEFDLDFAIGAQLDVVGEWVGVNRYVTLPLPLTTFALDTDDRGFDEGYWSTLYDGADSISALPDDLYRQLLYAKIKGNSWDGLTNSALDIVTTYLSDPATRVFMNDDTRAIRADVEDPLFAFDDPSAGFDQGRWAELGEYPATPEAADISYDICIAGMIPSRVDLGILNNEILPIHAMGAQVQYCITTVDGAPVFGFDEDDACIGGFDSGAWGTDPATLLGIMGLTDDIIISPDPTAAFQVVSLDALDFSHGAGQASFLITFAATIDRPLDSGTFPHVVVYGDGFSDMMVARPGSDTAHVRVTHTYLNPGNYTARLYAGTFADVTAGTAPELASAFVRIVNKVTDYTFSFLALFPTNAVFLPAGTSVTQTVPDTLDLADIATAYIQGATNSVDPNAYYAPQAAALSADFSYDAPGPKFVLQNWGAPNWAEVMTALACAREMTDYDRDDAFGTVTIQSHMMQNMLDPAANIATGTNIVIPNAGITPATYGLLLMLRHYKQTGAASFLEAINIFLRMHRNTLNEVQQSGTTFTYFYDDGVDQGATSIGDLGYLYAAFVQGVALNVMEEVNLALGSDTAHAMSIELTNYVLHSNNDRLWTSPNRAVYDFAPFAGFTGHAYSWLEATRGVLLYAKALQNSEPVYAQQLINFAGAIYDFVKRQVRPSWIGNFGSSGTTADMIRIGLLLADFGVGDFYDEVDAWTRNQMVESQIDAGAAAYIPNNNDTRWQYDHVGLKVKGLFFADASHIFGIPSVSQAFTTDDHAFSFLGLHTVWEHTAHVVGTALQIDFHMNRAHRYCDVLSDVPYRGRVEVDLKSDLGPITSLLIRIPTYLPNQDGVQIVQIAPDNTETSLPLIYGGPYGHHAVVLNVQPGERYALIYPTILSARTITQKRDGTHAWWEGIYTTQTGYQTIQSWSGTFRGTTLVSSNAPAQPGIPRYAESWRAHLASLGASEEAPPYKSASRFAYTPPIQS